MARELDLAGLERALWPHFRRPPRDLALAMAIALYREGALSREELIEKAGIGRRRLAAVEAAVRLGPLLELKRRVASRQDGSARLVLAVNRLGGNVAVEAVTVPRRDDLSLCLSSQAGCPLACSFCATGHLGFRADLTAGEIVEQHAWARRTARRRPTDVVFMGMGEPLLNYDAVMEAAYRLTRVEGAQISPRRIVISTAGIVPRIRQYAREGHPFQLFFSLTSAIPEKRRKLMPIERSYPLPDLTDAIREYLSSRRRNKRATLEYVAIPEENMGREDVDALAELLRGMPSIINVIPYNSTSAGFRPPTWAEVKAFTTALRSLEVPVKIRYSGGKTVGAGCGQLAADELPKVELPTGKLRAGELPGSERAPNLPAPAPLSGHMTAPPGVFSDLHSTVDAPEKP